MEWESYVREILSEKDALDELSVSIDGGKTQSVFPPVIRASIRILDRILEDDGRLNIFVFPEKQQMLLMFMLAKVIHNMTEEKIKSNYDPSLFTPGSKVKLGNAVAEFLSVDTINGKRGIRLRFCNNAEYFCPIDILPVLQRAKTRVLSSDKKFYKEKKRIQELMKKGETESVIRNLLSHKSHLDKSIAYIGSVSATKARLNECLLDNHRLQEILLLGQTSYEGEVKNISTGQLDGKPALVLASDLFAVNATAAMGHPFQSMIIDLTNVHQVLSQLDALDEAIALGIPLLCMTDTPDAFELSEFRKRGFKVWRWNAVSLTNDLMGDKSLLDFRLRNCSEHNVHYNSISDLTLSECMTRLSRQKNVVADQNTEIINLYDQMVEMTFRALRETVDFEACQIEKAQRVYERCRSLNLLDSSFVPEEMAKDLNFAADALKKIYSGCGSLPKNQAIKEWFLQNGNERTICIIVPENMNKKTVMEYWHRVCLQNRIKCEIKAYFPTEYCNLSLTRFDTTVILGWMRREIMRKVIFSFATLNYEIFLYECERKWKNNEERLWAKAISGSDNKSIISNTLSRPGSGISVTRWETDERYGSGGETEDLSELEQVLKGNKYRQFTKGAEGVRTERCRAIPVSFIGGYVAFYRLEHKILQVTNVLNGISDKIRIITPDKLEEGDFVIVRETDQNLIREMADRILVAEGKSGLREISGKWREPLSIELALSSSNRETVYRKLREAGCRKGMITFNNWIDDEDMIAPQNKEDIRIIAEAFDNETLHELQDKVYDAAKEVRRAHTQAGMQLSKLLRERIAQELKNREITDIYNIWNPIPLEVEGVGTVQLLKVIDIETEMETGVAMTNRLLSE